MCQRPCRLLLFRTQRPTECDLDRSTLCAFVTQRHGDPRGSENLQCGVHAAAGQADVPAGELGAGNDTRLAVCREAQCLGFVEFRILERGHAHQLRDHLRWKLPAWNVELISEHDGQRRRERPVDWWRGSLYARGWQKPRFSIVIFRGQPDGQDPAGAAAFLDQCVDPGCGDPVLAREKRPLVRKGREVVIDEDGIARPACRPLQWQGDQITQTAPRQVILAGEQSVVGREAEVRRAIERSCDHERAQAPSLDCGDRLRQEQPSVRSLARARTLDGDRQIVLPADCDEGMNIPLPISLVEVRGQERTLVIGQQRIHTRHERLVVMVMAFEMPRDHLVRDRKEGLIRAGGAFDGGFAAEPRLPLVGARRRITASAGIRVLPAHWIHVCPAAEQSPEQRDLGRRGRVPIDRRVSGGFRARLGLRQPLDLGR